jgi:hypothetical protein
LDQLTEGHLNLLDTIYDTLRTKERWPTYGYLEDLLDSKFDANIEELGRTIPEGLTTLPLGGYRASEQQEIQLTIDGLRRSDLPGAAEDVELFFRIFRRFVSEQKNLVPTIESQPKPCLATEGLSMEWSVHPTVLRRVFRFIALEPWVGHFSGIGPDGTNLQICASRILRQFRAAKTLDEYLEIRRAFFAPSRPTPVTVPDALRSLDRVAEAATAARTASAATANPTPKQWDVFIAHASADKEKVVRPLAVALKAARLEVWLDEFELTVGDNLRRKIEEGLRHSKYGVVILSPDFFESDWSQAELDGLAQLEVDHRKVILPVLHRMRIADVRARSPMLADRLAVPWSRGVDYVVRELLRAMK